MTRCDMGCQRVWWMEALALMLVTFALRIYHLGLPNLTNDEWFMLRNHDEGPVWIIHQAHTFEPHPLLYYLGLAGWIELAGRSEFAMRFPSVFFGVILVPATIGLGRQLLGARAGLMAGVLITLAPYQIMEAQNARNYAMVVALGTVASLLFVRAMRHQQSQDWAGYTAAMLLALNTHLNAALVLAAHLVHGLLRCVSARTRSLQVDRRWVAANAVILIAFALWLSYAYPALSAYQGYFPERVGPLQVAVRTLATFSLGQGAPVRQSLPFLGVAALGLGWTTWRYRWSAVFLALAVFLPLLLVSAWFMVRPMFDERYLIVLAPPFLLLVAAGLDAVWDWSWVLGLVSGAAVLAYLFPTIPATYQAELTNRGDFRAMAAWIATDGAPDDPIVATGYGQAELFDYYAAARGERRVAQVIDQPSRLAAELPLLLQAHRGLWLLPYWQSPADQAALSVLERIAAPAAERWFVNTRAIYYASTAALGRALAVHAVWTDHLALRSARLGPSEVAPGEAVGTELEFAVDRPLATPKLSLRLLDDAGDIVAQHDVALAGTPVIAGDGLLLRVGLVVPPAVPPGQYDLAVLVYQPDSGAPLRLTTTAPTRAGAVQLGKITVLPRQRPVPASEAGVSLVAPLPIPPGVSLLGHDALGPPRPAGDWLSFRVLWRADRAPLPPLDRAIVLRGPEGRSVTLCIAPILPSFPTPRWTTGQLLIERIRCQIPATLTGGAYRVELQVRPDGGVTVPLGDLIVSGPSRSFSRPQVDHPLEGRFGTFALLLGDRLPVADWRPGALVHLTLYWSAIGTADRSYTVFVHLLDPTGQIRGQIDRIPVAGTRPTDGWIAGEYLTDEYEVPLSPDAPPGRYRIEVGMYDAETGQRVPITRASGEVSDHLVIETFDVHA